MKHFVTPPAYTQGRWISYFHEEESHWSVHAINENSGVHFEHELARVLSSGKEAEANARLMAAAPELLDACKDTLEFLSWFPVSLENGEITISKEAKLGMISDTDTSMGLIEVIARAEGTA